MNWKDELRQLKLEHIKTVSPGFFELSGGYKMRLNPYSDVTTNGLTNAVYDYLKYSGHYVNRINSQGQMRKIDGKMRYTNGSTNLGTADLDSIINGKPVKLEIKNKNTRDRVSKDQMKEKSKIEASGGHYWIITDMDSFIEQYRSFIKNKPSQNGQERKDSVAC